jgi:hypothetical protein
MACATVTRSALPLASPLDSADVARYSTLGCEGACASIAWLASVATTRRKCRVSGMVACPLPAAQSQASSCREHTELKYSNRSSGYRGRRLA